MSRFQFQNIFSKQRLEQYFPGIKRFGLRTALKKATSLLKQKPQPVALPTPVVNTESYFTQLFRQTFPSSAYVPFKHNLAPVSNPDIKLIAFYLPQFHPIKENDEWWGKGFTEWTNVTKAVPQFIGHYQPHLADQLGYYDLRLKAVQQHQIDLAKEYGIYGFCYHHYWFNNTRILETPLDTVLNSPELDLPFCINWANENWTRRWDGLEQDILLAQRHSADDDLAFIENTARYMRDPRYIRIDGKPLLLLYRPGLLPDVRATANHWRKWCREHSIGEIYLVITHAFEHINPNEIGFDAAIEYAPNTYPMKPITEQIRASGMMVNPDYQGIIFDYNQAVEYGQNQPLPSYKKIRCLFPGWDNEARSPGRGITFINNSPLKFQRWLSYLLSYTQKHFKPSERFIFVNAWNEWAEGAHLEPDRKYGFSYLEACRVATQLHTLTHEKPAFISQTEPNNRIAIVIHAFYLDVFDEMLQHLEAINKNTIKLFVTTPETQLTMVTSQLAENDYDFTCVGVTNRGRDILSFIKILPEIYNQNFTYLVKVHTKKSVHRADGAHWRNDLYTKLLDPPVLEENIKFLQHHPEIGILAPEDHLVSMGHYLAFNEKYIRNLAVRLGMEMETVLQLPFVAGSMFSARTHALIPLLLLNFVEEDFEPEQGQLDGTLAHAIERMFSVCANRLDYQIRTRSGKINGDYAHAEKSIVDGIHMTN
jgi:lipopolysaccharide biosynthesis protein